MTYKELMFAAWQAQSKAILVGHPDGVQPTQEELDKLYSGLRGAKHEASCSGVAELDDYNLRCKCLPEGIRIEFELKRKIRDRMVKQNPEEYM